MSPAAVLFIQCWIDGVSREVNLERAECNVYNTRLICLMYICRVSWARTNNKGLNRSYKSYPKSSLANHKVTEAGSPI